MRSLSLILLLTLACGDDDQPPVIPDEIPEELPAPDLRLLILTDLQGTLAPCGCTSEPLGGIDRMVARARELSQQVPTAILVAGDLLFPQDMHGAGETSLWQAQTLLGILAEADVQAATPGPGDLRMGPETFLALQELAGFPFLAASWTLQNENEAQALAGSLVLEIGDARVGVIGVSSNDALQTLPPLEAAEQALAELPAEVDLRIAMVRGDRRLSRRVAGLEGVDFVVQGGLDREEALPPAQVGQGWVLHASRQGQGLVVLDLYRRGSGGWTNISPWTREVEEQRLNEEIAHLESRLAEWRREGANEADIRQQDQRRLARVAERDALRSPALPAQHNAFAARWVALEHDAPQDPAVERRLAEFDVRVNDHNRVALADRTPPPVDEGQAHYVGSASCASCHAQASSWWQAHPHGRAYATLSSRHKEYHLDCVGCHVTGYQQPGGSTVTHNRDGALVNVGCEVCHGPGSAHAASPATSNIQRAVTERLCLGCHTEEHSDLFNFEAYRARLLVPGHGAE